MPKTKDDDMTTLLIKENYVKELKNGYPLILKDAVENEDASIIEGTLVKLVDNKGQYIATGYYGVQNKGVGWVLTRNANEQIDRAFLRREFMRL